MKKEYEWKPDAADQQKVFLYLDGLRESGKINMFGATPVIEDVFGVNKSIARELLAKWMATYGERHGKEN